MWNIEGLEPRRLFSFPPLPIVPSTGEAAQLAQALKKAAGGNFNALDNFPVPAAVVASANGAAPVVTNWKAGNGSVKIDADSNKATGQGGNDISVNIQTVLLPTPHLTMTITRLDGAPYASDLEVLIAFPFDAFNTEALPGDPNLFLGYRTNAANGAVGGHAPQSETIELIPHILGGTDHSVEFKFTTLGADNPMRFLTGEFDGTNLTGIVNAGAYTAYVETPPQNLSIGLGVGDSALSILPGSSTNMSFNMTWDASSRTKAQFAYMEEESGNLSDPDFQTTITVDQMPTHEQLSLSLNEATSALTLSHRANQTIGNLTVLSKRNDGLTITGTATDIPTAVDLSVDLHGAATLDVNANTLDLQLSASQMGGFDGTTGFFNYPIGYASIKVTDAPDLTAGYNPATDSFSAHATNPGESIGSVELVIGDDANLELPPSYNDVPTHHLFSLVDDGSHGTVVARVVHLQDVTFDLDPNASEAWHMTLGEAAPAQLYLKTTPASTIVPHDAEITADLDVIPAGTVFFHEDVPGKFGYTITPPAGQPPVGIDNVHIFGHFDTTNFDIDAGGLPAIFDYDFDPAGHLTVKAESAPGVPSTIGHIAARVFDSTGLSGTSGLLGLPIKDARFRVDSIPSFHGTWSDAANTSINFNTDQNDVFLGGAQFSVSTAVDLGSPLPVASASAHHYLNFADAGLAGTKHLAAGAFGIDEFSYASNDAAASYTVHYDTNAQHQLDVGVNSAFGGRFFPNFHINTALNVNSVPQLWDMTLDVDPEFHYHGTQGIASITLTGVVDDTNNGADDGTNIAAMLLGMPKDVDFVLHPDSDASLTMNAAATLVALHLDSNNSIFGSGYRLLEASIANIPAHWTANWGGGQFLLEAKDASDNPAPMGAVTATISRSNVAATNAAFKHPFEISGAGGARINYSPFLQDIDRQFYNAGGAPDAGAATLAVLDQLYNHAQVLTGGDHAVAQINGGSLDYFDGQFTGFQKIAYQPDANGGHFEFDAPSTGLHPFLAGVGFDTTFLVAHIDNIPDTATLDINFSGGNIHFHTTDDTGATAGTIDIYYGPAGMAQDSDTAARAVMLNTPDDVLLTWNFGSSDGAANFVASNAFRLLFLAQDGSNRIAAGLQLKELQAGYGLDFLPLTVTSTTTLGVPTGANLTLFRANAGIDNDASNAVGVGNAAKPGVSGFFNLYQMTTSDLTTTSGGVSPGAAEYTPTVTFQMKDFTRVNFTVSVEVTLIAVLELPGTLHIHPSLDGPDGQFALQLWSSANTDEEFLGAVGIVNPPDYHDNTPFFIIPLGSPQFDNLHDLVFSFGGFGTFADLFDPFA